MSLSSEPKSVRGGSAAAQPAQDNRRQETVREILSFLKTLVMLVILAGVLRASVVEAFKIPSESMKPTLVVGDHLLVNKLSYGIRVPFVAKTVWRYSMPERGDIVVFTRPEIGLDGEEHSSVNIIKRVIGLPGDVVEVKNTRLYINNKLEHEPYQVRWEEGGIGDFKSERVPQGHVLLLGDNRDKSRDSRFWENPFLDLRRVKGRAFIIYWNWPYFRRVGSVLR